MPRRWVFRPVTVKGYVDRVEVVADGQAIAAHPRSYGRQVKVLDPLHFLVALERKPAALDHAVRQRLLAASPATIDRRLAPARSSTSSCKQRKRATKPGKQIPVRTFADWKEPPPGYLEIDCVAHGGSSRQGAFLWSLVATDVCSGWTEAVPLLTREQSLVAEGLEVIRRQFPVPVL